MELVCFASACVLSRGTNLSGAISEYLGDTAKAN
jgi:hypothetical protein